MSSGPHSLHTVTASASAAPPSEPDYDHEQRAHHVVETSSVQRHHHSLNQYSLGSPLGQGQHGKVMLGYNLLTNERVAIKVVKRKSKTKHLPRETAIPVSTRRSRLVNNIGSTENKIKKEIAIMKKCNHHHVVKLLEVIDDPMDKKIYMILEYMEGGEIKWRDQDKNPVLTLDQIRRIFRDVVLGLEYLHYQGIIHRDVKPSNLLWNKERSIVKISDFGVSHFSYAQRLAAAGQATASDAPIEDILMDENDLAKTAGSPAFFAPELVYSGDPEPNAPIQAKPPITKAIDIWALGITLYCLLFGRPPFEPPTEWQLFQMIPVQDYPVPAVMGLDRVPTGGREKRIPPPSESFYVMDILEKLLVKNPLHRITIPQIKQHEWIVRDMPGAQDWQLISHPGSVEVTAKDAARALSSKWGRKIAKTGRALLSGARVSRTSQVPPSTWAAPSTVDADTLGRRQSERTPRAKDVKGKGKPTIVLAESLASKSQSSLPSTAGDLLKRPALNAHTMTPHSVSQTISSTPTPNNTSGAPSFLGVASPTSSRRSVSPAMLPPSPGHEARTLHGFSKLVHNLKVTGLRRPRSELVAGAHPPQHAPTATEPSSSEPLSATSRSGSWGDAGLSSVRAPELVLAANATRQSCDSIGTTFSSDYGDPNTRMYGAGGYATPVNAPLPPGNPPSTAAQAPPPPCRQGSGSRHAYARARPSYEAAESCREASTSAPRHLPSPPMVAAPLAPHAQPALSHPRPGRPIMASSWNPAGTLPGRPPLPGGTAPNSPRGRTASPLGRASYRSDDVEDSDDEASDDELEDDFAPPPMRPRSQSYPLYLHVDDDDSSAESSSLGEPHPPPVIEYDDDGDSSDESESRRLELSIRPTRDSQAQTVRASQSPPPRAADTVAAGELLMAVS